MLLGKRKRDVAVVRTQQPVPMKHEESEEHTGESHDMFRHYFESRFEPLPGLSKSATLPSGKDHVQTDTDDEVGSESDWGGLSDGEKAQDSTRTVEVVEHNIGKAEFVEDGLRGTHYKAFMSSRPPQEVSGISTKRRAKDDEEDDDAETLNLKHDLDLQRLLKESHLLEQAKSPFSMPGSHRHKATELRMQDLGSKNSILTQEKMPLSHKRGITAKAAAKESLRRTDAKESGIILERASKATARPAANRRDRGVDAPAVGRFRGGTLKLDKRDVAAIQGPSQRSGRMRKIKI